jgi:hypothetical protein
LFSKARRKFSLTPGPSPNGKGEKKTSSRLPLPEGEGWGEGLIKDLLPQKDQNRVCPEYRNRASRQII